MSGGKDHKRRKRAREQFRYEYGCCYYCGLTVEQKEPPYPRAATLDHLKPIARGGTSRMSNLVLACFRCNNEKGDMTETEYRRFRHMVMRGTKKREALRCVRGDSALEPTTTQQQDAIPDESSA